MSLYTHFCDHKPHLSEWMRTSIDLASVGVDVHRSATVTIALAGKTAEVQRRNGPFGAVCIGEKGRLVSSGHNHVMILNDPTMHGEVHAISEAKETDRLTGLVTSSEPCPMCARLIFYAGIQLVYYAATAEDAENAGFKDKSLYDALSLPVPERDGMTILDTFKNTPLDGNHRHLAITDAAGNTVLSGDLSLETAVKSLGEQTSHFNFPEFTLYIRELSSLDYAIARFSQFKSIVIDRFGASASTNLKDIRIRRSTIEHLSKSDFDKADILDLFFIQLPEFRDQAVANLDNWNRLAVTY